MKYEPCSPGKCSWKGADARAREDLPADLIPAGAILLICEICEQLATVKITPPAVRRIKWRVRWHAGDPITMPIWRGK